MKFEQHLGFATVILCIVQATSVSAVILRSDAEQENPSVTRFREYVRLKAVYPDPDYTSSIEWIKNQAVEIDLEYNYKEFEAPDLFAIWITWKGTDPNLPSILLNTHIDVVPVDEDKWTHDPFGAEKDENGNIYGRGTQDMKNTAVQYLEAIRNLKSRGVTPLRNVHVLFIPDEENGGLKGMKPFIETEEFKNLNIGFGTGEGRTSIDDTLHIVWADRVVFRVVFKATGQSGHGSILHENTAAEKIQKIINAMLELREKEKQRMKADNLTIGEVTTINLTVMKGGEQPNTVPSEISVTFDIRITPSWNISFVEDFLENVRFSAGPGVTLEYVIKTEQFASTPLTADNVWWNVFQTTAKELNLTLVPTINGGATDSKYLREIGIPAFGFTAQRNTPRLAHDHNEFVKENEFLDGIKINEQFLPRLFNLPSNENEKSSSGLQTSSNIEKSDHESLER